MTVVRITNPPITVRVGTPLAPRVTSSATFVGSSANLVNEINYAVDLAEQASATANAAAANVTTKVSKSGDTMTGDLKFGGGGGILGNFATDQIAITANVDSDVSGFFAQKTGVSVVYANTDVIIQANTGSATFSQWNFNADSSLGLPGNVIPFVANTSNLGSENNPFNEIHGTIVTVNGGTF